MNTSPATESDSALKAGEEAPDFTLPADSGKTVSLAQLRGGNVVLYFYPKDDTPGCTVEAKEFRDLLADFRATATEIIGMSRDDPKSHDKFKKKFCLPFALASDIDGSVCESYGVWVEKSMYGKKHMGIERTTFLIDGQGKIAQVWNKVKPEGHAREVLEAAKKLK